jgi:hypothetical protein
MYRSSNCRSDPSNLSAKSSKICLSTSRARICRDQAVRRTRSLVASHGSRLRSEARPVSHRSKLDIIRDKDKESVMKKLELLCCLFDLQDMKSVLKMCNLPLLCIHEKGYDLRG